MSYPKLSFAPATLKPVLVVSLLLGAAGVGATTMAQLDDDGVCMGVAGATEYRRYDGRCNNLTAGNADWGSAGIRLLRVHGEANYAADHSTPQAVGLRSPREISNTVAAQPKMLPNGIGVSDMLMQWGQFLDHDIDLTHTSKADPMPIVIPPGDTHFSGQMSFSRSVYDASTGVDAPREQINAITAFIDASQIYGSDRTTADSLRSWTGGKLKMSGPAAAPLLHMEMTERGPMFVSGDERVNEQVGLTAMHTLFNREHNRLAEELATRNPGLDDETLYQETRKLVGGIMQAITYNEFLPALLGDGAPGQYAGYDPTVNPGVANEFSTAAYRFGHSTLSSTLKRLDAQFEPVAAGPLPLEQAFFNPGLLLDSSLGGIEAILRGLVRQRGQEVDPYLIGAVRNLLFANSEPSGFDLAALNIQRGRDHGLPGFNAMREALGLGAYADWDDAEFLPGIEQLLTAAYDDVDDIDLWIGGLAEAHVDGGMLGEVFSMIVRDQFERARDGDRFWYQNAMFEPEWIDYIERSTLSRVIARNTGISGLFANVFFVPVPGGLALLAIGLIGFAGRRRHQRANAGLAIRSPRPTAARS